MNNKLTNYKQTEIGEIPQDWDLVEAGTLVSTISKTFDFSDRETVVFLNTGDVSQGKVLLHKPISTDGLPGQAKKSIQKDDILFSEIRPKNKRFAYVDFEAKDYVVSTKLMVLRTNNKILPKYFLYYITSEPILNYLQLLAESRSGTFPQITFSEVSSLNFPLPTIAEQKQIVKLIESLDKKIELNRKMNQTLEEIGEALFKHWFSNKNDSIVKLSELIEFNPRESLKKGEIATYLEMKDLPEQGMWAFSDIKKPYKGGTKFRNGDTLMARITPCLENGKSALVNFLQDDELAFGSTEYIVFRPKNSNYLEYVYFLVRDERFRQHAIKSMVGSSGRQRVQHEAVKNYEVGEPSKEKIKDFHKLMSPLFKKIKNNALENEALSKIRDSLLPRLMSGKLRVN